MEKQERKMQRKRVVLDRALAMKMYMEGATDKEIADKTGVSKTTVVYFRHVNGLPIHRETDKGTVKRKKKVLSQLDADAIEARRLGMNYGIYKAMSYRPEETVRRSKAWRD